MGYHNSHDEERAAMYVLDVPRKVFDASKESFPADLRKDVEEGYRYSEIVSVDMAELAVEDLRNVYEAAKKIGDTVYSRKLAYLINTLEDDDDEKIVKKVEGLVLVLRNYFHRHKIDGWIYTRGQTGEPLPYALTAIKYHPPVREGRNNWPDYVTLTGAANAHGRKDTFHTTFYREDLKGTIKEVLLNKGIFVETPKLKMQYLKALAAYEENVHEYAKQYTVSGAFKAYTHDSENSRHDRYSWRSRTREDQVDLHLTSDGKKQRVLVVEDELADRVYEPYALTNVFLSNEEGNRTLQLKRPFHPYIYCFALERQEFFWVHALDLERYVYDRTLRDKLILPEAHSHLIDALVNDLEVFKEDVIAGKSGGTVILCQGAPGLGKTLTAEVYSEITERPLYRVHSGQLGVEHEALEEMLKLIMARADRWKVALLIDEADVYIRARGDDLEQNAVVASFLRTMEYFSGLLFLTTNRGDEIDDAIASRCVAIVKYEKPGEEDCKRLWRVLSDHYGVPLSDKLINQLWVQFKGLPGRDIKNLIRLTDRYVRARKIDLNLEAFKACGMFRNL